VVLAVIFMGPSFMSLEDRKIPLILPSMANELMNGWKRSVTKELFEQKIGSHAFLAQPSYIKVNHVWLSLGLEHLAIA
jgi:hypothetical protein